jgi:hypothetical protein
VEEKGRGKSVNLLKGSEPKGKQLSIPMTRNSSRKLLFTMHKGLPEREKKPLEGQLHGVNREEKPLSAWPGHSVNGYG